MKRRNKVLLVALAVVIVVVLVVANMTSTGSKGITVQAEEAKNREIVEDVSASGRVQPKTKVDITSEVNGEIIGLMVKEGDRVEKGALLVILDTVQWQSDADQARFAVIEVNARLEGANSSLLQAEEEYDRQKRLYEGKLTSETAYTNAKYAYLTAKSTHEATAAQAKQLQARLDKQLDYLSKTKILAPMSGVITFLDCEVGEIAAAQTIYSQGKTLMTIADLEVFEVEVDVDETEITKVEVGQEVEIEVDAFPDTVFLGEVVEVGNTAIVAGMGTQDQSTDFKVKVVFKDADVKIKPGMSATVDITTNRRDDALVIPYSAVVMRTYDMDSLERARDAEAAGGRDSGELHAAEADSAAQETADADDDEKRPEEIKGVFVIREGKAWFVAIETGIADQTHIEVTSGIQEGDSVVSGPYRVLRTVDDGNDVRAEGGDKNEDKRS